MEVQSLGVVGAGQGSPEVQSIGWTILQLFDESKQLKEGLIKLPLLTPPMHIQRNTEIVERPRNPHMTLFIRNVNFCNAQHAKGFVVDSSVTQHLYKYPFSTTSVEPTVTSNKTEQRMSQTRSKEPQPASKAGSMEEQTSDPVNACEEKKESPIRSDNDDKRAEEQLAGTQASVNGAVQDETKSCPTVEFSLGIKINSLIWPSAAPGSLLAIRILLLRDDRKVNYTSVLAETAALHSSEVRTWETKYLPVEEGVRLDVNAVGPEDFSAAFEFTEGSVLVFEVLMKVDVSGVEQENGNAPARKLILPDSFTIAN